jgi:hypothetical protein
MLAILFDEEINQNGFDRLSRLDVDTSQERLKDCEIYGRWHMGDRSG